MSLDQLLVRLRQAWVVQRQQIQVILGALFFLVCIVCWEKSQWTQPARSDLLHNLPQSAHLANLSTSDNSPHGGSNSDSVNAWSCKHSRTWFRGQRQRWPELEELADTYCQLALSSEPEGAHTLLQPPPEPAPQHLSCNMISSHASCQPTHGGCLVFMQHASSSNYFISARSTGSLFCSLTGILTTAQVLF